MIRTYVGPMFSGKSDSLITIYSKIWNKKLVLAFKPKADTRDGAEIKSKNFDLSIPAIFIKDLKEIKKHIKGKNIHTIFIDEAQFLTGDVKELVKLSIEEEIDFYIAGLNMTAEQKPFGLMPNILAVSDAVHTITGFCQECNKPSVYTYYVPGKKVDNVVGDEGYISLCQRCLKKHLLKDKKGKK